MGAPFAYEETLPAASVCLAVMEYVPLARVLEVMLTVLAAQVPVPSVLRSLDFTSVTVASDSQLMVNDGVVSVVVEDPPTIAGVPGAAMVVSIVTERLEDADDSVPAASVCLAVIVWTPSLSTDEVMVTGELLHAPEPSDVEPS